MAIDIEIKKKLAKDWQEAFPQLSLYNRDKLYKVLGGLVVGLELIKIPHEEKYRPHFVTYPLWEKDIKSCLNYPFILQEFHNEKNLQYNIPYTNNDQILFQNVVKSVWLQSPISFNGNISFNDLTRNLDNYSKTAPMLSSRDSRMFGLFMESKLKIALYLGKDLANDIFTEIKNHRWDKNHFRAFNVEVESWINKLELEINNRNDFLKQIEINKQDKKISNLQKSEITK